MATSDAQQWLIQRCSQFENLANQLHADLQLFLQPPPSDLSVEVRTSLRQSKPCQLLEHLDFLFDSYYCTGLNLPNDTRGLQVVDVKSTIADRQIPVATTNYVETLGLAMRPQALLQELQQYVQTQQLTIDAIAAHLGIQVPTNALRPIAIAPNVPFDVNSNAPIAPVAHIAPIVPGESTSPVEYIAPVVVQLYMVIVPCRDQSENNRWGFLPNQLYTTKRPPRQGSAQVE